MSSLIPSVEARSGSELLEVVLTELAGVDVSRDQGFVIPFGRFAPEPRKRIQFREEV
jgi:hypothetical protein